MYLQDGLIMRCIPCNLAYNTVVQYEKHMKKYHHSALECDDCGKKFTMPNVLKKHVLNHHTHFPKICDECGHFCTTKEVFKAHMAETHGEGIKEEPTVPCEICGKMFKSSNSLKTHVKLLHSGKTEGDFPCEQCGKVFRSKATLEYHTRVHTGDYPYRCDECGNGFMKLDMMIDCKNNHAGIFKFHCTHCEYKTNNSKQYKRHLTTHSSEKPLQCPICQHQSSHNGNLNSHIRKVHKLTLVKAEIVTRRNRWGRAMTEEELEVAKKKMENAEKALDTQKLRPNTNTIASINRQKKEAPPLIKSQPADEGSNDDVATYHLNPSRVIFPYF